MLKQTKINLGDTNLALFGSDTEPQLKEEASHHEAAWQVTGKGPGLFIWRIQQFKVTPINPQTYGAFYDGDSYIILHTYKGGGDKLLHDLHFWLGAETSQDESGTAAYKTVELDDYLKGEASQHREVQSYESDLFKTYFPKGIQLMHGGVETGFHHVQHHEYKPRLFQICGAKHPISVEVALAISSLNSCDVFILDGGLHLYQFIGQHSSILERGKATQIVQAIDESREGKAEKHVLHEGDTSHSALHFWQILGATGPQPIAATSSVKMADKPSPKKELYRLFEDAAGKLEITSVATEGDIKRSLLKEDDAYILDLGPHVFVWFGTKASAKEKRKGLHHAQSFLTHQGRHASLSISTVKQGFEHQDFLAHFP